MLLYSCPYAPLCLVSEFAIIILIVGGRIVRRNSCINILIISPHHFEEMLGTVKVISTWLIKLTLGKVHPIAFLLLMDARSPNIQEIGLYFHHACISNESIYS